ncbi:unnamed protein product [Caenorhabditis bovis]|uniref:TOG domain-containing protein n=1 Tax=Caenorhabditis bovis TaxID=2654633 RepID=A0A8S1EGF4_9PELO|nr:unnamed protein product [Caenorhabditis bovis]
METNWLHILLQRNTADSLERLKLGNVILSEVSHRKISPHPKLVNDFLDVMCQWLSGSNFKVSTIGLEILHAALKTSPEVLASYYFDRLNVLIERMGDSKASVRELALNLILQLAYLENSSPVMVLDRLCMSTTGFNHKQFLVKVGSLTILREFLATSFALVIQQTVDLIRQICELTNSPNSEVRDAASNTLLDLMVFGGMHLVERIMKTRILNEQKMAMLMQRYQSTLAVRGDLPPKHTIVMEPQQPQRNTLMRRSLRSPAKISYPARLSTPPRALQTPVTVAQSPSTANRSREMRPGTIGRQSMSLSRYRSSSCAPSAVCAVNADDFRKAFSAVPKTTIYSNQDVRDKLELAKSVLNNPQEDWSKRSNQLKLIRSIVLNSDEYIDRHTLVSCINDLADALECSVRDLRSQVVRESAVTCCFLFETFGNDVRNIAETVLPAAISQLAVSTKIMATSAATLTLFIVEKIQSRQVFSIISEMVSSKAKEQRRQLAILLGVLLTNWDSKAKQPILRQIGGIVRNLLNDADGETRVAARKVFTKLEQCHSEIADQIFMELDASKQRMLREGAASSSSSLNSDRESNKQMNISQKFLSQRSASALDAKAALLSKQPSTTHSRPTTNGGAGTRLPKSTSTTYANVRSTGYGAPRSKTPVMSTGFTRATSPTPPSNKSSSSSPCSSTIQTPIQRVASNLGSSSFVASLTQEQASSLQMAMDKAREEMNRHSENGDDDEFLLSNVKPLRSSPPTDPIDPMSNTLLSIEHVLKACGSSSSNEKRDAVKILAGIVSETKISDYEAKRIGDTLLRLMAEGGNTLLVPVLETCATFVKIHHQKLIETWLKLALGKLFSRLGSETLPNVRATLAATQKAFLVSFDPSDQLKAVCEYMCDRVNLLIPKARLALLEHLCFLMEDIWPDDHRYIERNIVLDTPYTRNAICKMFEWMFDSRNGPMLMTACERLICAMFALNAADFTMIFNDLSPECRDWARRILQLNGQNKQEDITKESESERNLGYIRMPTSSFSEPEPTNESTPPPPVPVPRPSYQNTEYFSSETPARVSTAHLASDLAEQSIFIRAQLTTMQDMENAASVNEAMSKLHGMMCEGSFTLWAQFFDVLLHAVYQVLADRSLGMKKKMALRILMKMCNAQAAKLFDSTEILICKVLDAVTNSNDSTMGIAAEDCLRTFASHLPLPRIINTSQRILEQNDDTRSILILKMLTRMFQDIDADELAIIVDEVSPCFVKAYDSPSSSVRKCVVFGLASLLNRVGPQRLEPHLRNLNPSQRNLIDLYVNRARTAEGNSPSF